MTWNENNIRNYVHNTPWKQPYKNKHTWRDRNTKRGLLQIPAQWCHRTTKWPNIQTSPLISDLNSKINSPGQATNKILKTNNYNNSDLNSNCQLSKLGDRNKFNTHNNCWKCCIDNERPTGKKHTSVGWDNVKW